MESKEDRLLQNDNSSLNKESYETFKSYPIIAGYSWMLWAGVGFFGYLFITRFNNKPRQTVDLISDVCMLIYIFILFSWNMNYFQVSQNSVRILKHNLFWIKKVYKLSDIQQIVLIQNRKLGNALKVVTTDFKSKTYFAVAPLKNKTWLNLKDKLESYNITVIDERPQE